MDADHAWLRDVNNDCVCSEQPLVLRYRNSYNRLTNSEVTGRVRIVSVEDLEVLRATEEASLGSPRFFLFFRA